MGDWARVLGRRKLTEVVSITLVKKRINLGVIVLRVGGRRLRTGEGLVALKIENFSKV